MRIDIRNGAVAGALLLGLTAMPAAQAIPTLVQFSTDGSGDGVTDVASGG